ncbi:hypothetical protein B7486_42280 [cyanobacterium TDX16]|nr:hypothetical protein B7486_42280 [cyanobacterium TDX16]
MSRHYPERAGTFSAGHRQPKPAFPVGVGFFRSLFLPEKTDPREKQKNSIELLLDSAWMTRGESKAEGGGGKARTVTAERPAQRAAEGRRGPCDPATGVETIPGENRVR